MSELRGRRLGQRDFATTLYQAKQGDGQAYGDLFLALAPRVAAFARTRGVEDPDATVNEVFLRAFQNLDKFRGNEKAFTGWVFQIARNRIIDEHRSRSTRAPTVSIDEHAVDPSAGDLVELWLDDQTGTAETMQLLEVLNEDQREIVLMRVVGGLSFAEIGKATGRRASAVRASYKRSRTALERYLAARERGDEA